MSISIRHSSGTYEVEFCELAKALQRLPTRSVVVTDRNVADAYPDILQMEKVVVVEPGESSKSLESYRMVVEQMLVLGCNRKTTVVAVGGGVIGDLAGFVAATYMRGLDFVQIPTTLLAMVDSSVGGKVGVDLPSGKNLVGAFCPPEAVYVCHDTLATLSNRQFHNGMAEVCKYGFILSRELSDRLGNDPVHHDSQDLVSLIRSCIELKAHVVEHDEFETKGLRVALNFGHTVGHAIEQALGYQEVLHGEAIAVGMRVEAELSEDLGIAAAGTAAEVCRVLSIQGLDPRLGRGLPVESLLAAMKRDKKAHGNGYVLSLLTKIGECTLVENVQEDRLKIRLNNL